MFPWIKVLFHTCASQSPDVHGSDKTSGADPRDPDRGREGIQTFNTFFMRMETVSGAQFQTRFSGNFLLFAGVGQQRLRGAHDSGSNLRFRSPNTRFTLHSCRCADFSNQPKESSDKVRVFVRKLTRAGEELLDSTSDCSDFIHAALICLSSYI